MGLFKDYVDINVIEKEGDLCHQIIFLKIVFTQFVQVTLNVNKIFPALGNLQS